MYESIRAIQRPEGRFVFILGTAGSDDWSTPADHRRIAASSGYRLVQGFRHQALPSSAYAHLPAVIPRLIDGTLGRIAGVRSVFVFEAV